MTFSKHKPDHDSDHERRTVDGRHQRADDPQTLQRHAEQYSQTATFSSGTSSIAVDDLDLNSKQNRDFHQRNIRRHDGAERRHVDRFGNFSNELTSFLLPTNWWTVPDHLLHGDPQLCALQPYPELHHRLEDRPRPEQSHDGSAATFVEGRLVINSSLHDAGAR